MNYALIFAGGAGVRMNSPTIPKQFLEIHGKPILIHTILDFENHEDIDGIVVSCLEGWEDHLRKLIDLERIKKVKWIVRGGTTGQLSIFNGLKAVYDQCDSPKETIMLIHDGVRPLLTPREIGDCISSTRQFDASLGVVSANEKVFVTDVNGKIEGFPPPERCVLSRSPTGVFLSNIMEAHLKAQADGLINFLTTTDLLMYYGFPVYTYECSRENIKITSPVDYYTFRSILDAKENAMYAPYGKEATDS